MSAAANTGMKRNFSKDAWIAILSGVFDIDVSSKLDSVDIDFNGLNEVCFAFMSERDLFALECFFYKKLTIKEIRSVIWNNKVTYFNVRYDIKEARRNFLHRINMMRVGSKIVGFGNLADMASIKFDIFWRQGV